MPNFETFTRRMVPLANDPTVTIQRRGTLSLNKSAQAALGDPDAVELLFDPEEKIIGLRPIDPRAPHAYPVRAQKQDFGPYLIAGMAFTKYYSIDTEASVRRIAYMDGDVLCIDLKSTGTIVTSNRSGRGSQEDSSAAAD